MIAVDPVSDELIADPLSYLFAQHWRQRQFCRALDEAAAMPEPPPALLAALATFLRADMGLHQADEEVDLFRLLRARAEPGDDIEPVLGILSADHAADRELTAQLLSTLDAAAEGSAEALARLPAAAGRFTSHLMRHLALENAVVLPIARLRLTPEDRDALARAMLARREGS